MDANLSLGSEDSLASLEKDLRPDLLDVYAHVGVEALSRAEIAGQTVVANGLTEDLDMVLAEMRLTRANQELRAIPGWQQTPAAVISPAKIEAVQKRAEGFTLSGDSPANWSLEQERSGTVAVTQRLAAFGVRPETVEQFRAGSDFLDAAAKVGEGTASKEPHYRLTYGRPETVREVRFVGSELEALAAHQLDTMKKAAPANEVQYVVVTGKLSDPEMRKLGAEVSDIVRAIKAQPGPAHSKNVKVVVAMPSTPEGREAQRIADRVVGHLQMQPEFGKLTAGTYSRELAGREAEFISRERNRARSKGVSVGPQRGGLQI
jgi:hypothetical protein